jgi:hypothetical protein
MDRQDYQGGQEGLPAMPEEEMERAEIAHTGPPSEEKKRRKVSLIAAIVVNIITILTVAIILLAVLLPGYRKSFTMARAVEGAEDVWIVVRTSETAMRENSTDFIKAQDGLRNALEELVKGGGDRVTAYVRDNFPDQAWVQENLPENAQQWLEQLYPKPDENTQDENAQEDNSTPSDSGNTQPSDGTGP